MPTLMSQNAFQALSDAREALRSYPWDQPGTPMGVFVPWVGRELKEKGRGLYFVGIAVAAEETAAEGSDFSSALQVTEDFVGDGRHSRSHAAFWQFLDCLTLQLLGGAFHETSAQWGWSNLLKIAWSRGSPASWPPKLIELQRAACVNALTEEFAALRESLVFISSYHEFGILQSIVRQSWNKELENSGIWWAMDPKAGNLYIHGYHPNAALRFWDDMLGRTVEVAQSRLPHLVR